MATVFEYPQAVAHRESEVWDFTHIACPDCLKHDGTDASDLLQCGDMFMCPAEHCGATFTTAEVLERLSESAKHWAEEARLYYGYCDEARSARDMIKAINKAVGDHERKYPND